MLICSIHLLFSCFPTRNLVFLVKQRRERTCTLNKPSTTSKKESKHLFSWLLAPLEFCIRLGACEPTGMDTPGHWIDTFSPLGNFLFIFSAINIQLQNFARRAGRR